MTFVCKVTTEFLQTKVQFSKCCVWRGSGHYWSVQNNAFVYDNVCLCYIRCNWWECHWAIKNILM